MSEQQIGYQTVDEGNLRGRMAASPTGRQLSIDGSFLLPLYTDDPADALLSPAEGLTVLWKDGATRKIASYTRAGGWEYVALA